MRPFNASGRDLFEIQIVATGVLDDEGVGVFGAARLWNFAEAAAGGTALSRHFRANSDAPLCGRAFAGTRAQTVNGSLGGKPESFTEAGYRYRRLRMNDPIRLHFVRRLFGKRVEKAANKQWACHPGGLRGI